MKERSGDEGDDKLRRIQASLPATRYRRPPLACRAAVRRQSSSERKFFSWSPVSQVPESAHACRLEPRAALRLKREQRASLCSSAEVPECGRED